MFRSGTWLFLWLTLVGCGVLAVVGAPADDQFSVAAAHYSQGRWRLAIEEFELFLQRFPAGERSESVRFFLGETFMQVQDYESARKHYRGYLKTLGPQKYSKQARFRLGEAAFLTKGYAEAERELARFAKENVRDPLNAYSLVYLGEIDLAGGRYAAAVEHFRASLQLFATGPLSSESRFGLARALESLGRPTEATRFYEFLAQGNNHHLADDATLRLALLHYKQKKFETAAELLYQFETRHSQSDLLVDARYWLGLVQMEQGDWPGALHALRDAARNSNKHPHAAAIYFALGETHRKSGDAAAAAKTYDTVATRYPDSPWADDASQLGLRLAFESRDHALIDSRYERFLQQHAHSPLLGRVRQLYARSLLQRESYAEAATVLETVLKDDREFSGQAKAAACYYLGLARLGLDEYEAALTALEQVSVGEDAAPLPSGPLQDGLQVARATALISLQRYTEAIEPLQRYLQSQPHGPDAAECRSRLVVALAETDKLTEAAAELEQLRKDDSERELTLETMSYLAEKAQASRELEIALPLFEVLSREADSQDLVARGLLGAARGLYREQRFAEAADSYARLYQLAPEAEMAGEYGFWLGRALQLAENRDDAIAAFRQVHTRNSESPFAPLASFEASKLLQSAGRLPESIALLQETVDQYPEYQQLDAVLYDLAWSCSDAGQGKESGQAFEQLVDRFPESEYWADAAYRVASAAAQRGEGERAGQILDRLLSREEELEQDIAAHSLYLQGQLQLADRNWEGMLKTLDQLTQKYAGHDLEWPSRYWRAEALYRLDRREEAAVAYDELGAHGNLEDPEWSHLVSLRKAQIAAQASDWTTAETLARQLAEAAEFSQAYEVDYLLGRCYIAKARFTKAREAYERVVASPQATGTETAARAQWMIGESYFQQKDYRSAIKSYHRVVILFKHPQWQAASLLQAGKCYELTKEWMQAVSSYRRLLDQFPESNLALEATRRLNEADKNLNR